MTKTKHPIGLKTLFFTEMWERMSYYGMRGILVLFMTASITNGGLDFSNASASAIYGIYAAAVYLMALPGGWIADNLFGQQKTIFFGGIEFLRSFIFGGFPWNLVVFSFSNNFLSFVITAPPSPDVITLPAYILKHPRCEKVPECLPFNFEPNDCDASSIILMCFFFAISRISSM